MPRIGVEIADLLGVRVFEKWWEKSSRPIPFDKTQRPQNTLAPLGPLGSHRVVCFIAWNWLRDDSQRAPRWRRLDAEMAWRWHGSLRGAEVKRKVCPIRLIKHKVWWARWRVDFDTPLKKDFNYLLDLFDCFSKFGFTRLWGQAPGADWAVALVLGTL